MMILDSGLLFWATLYSQHLEDLFIFMQHFIEGPFFLAMRPAMVTLMGRDTRMNCNVQKTFAVC